jgi:hypothetical protein
MKLSRRNFIGMAGVSVAAGALAAGGGKSCFRVAIMSDNQLHLNDSDWGWLTLDKALKQLAPMRIDLLVNAGDTSDSDNPSVVKKYLSRCRAALGGKVDHFACPGNHDVWLRKDCGNRTRDDALRDYFDCFGLSGSGRIRRRTIAGYDFVAIASSERVPYFEEDAAAIEAILCECRNRDPKKPIFVITHYQPARSAFGAVDRYGETLRRVFDKFPQVVSLSGHTHCPLGNERMIWQDGFTAINTSTTSYGCYPGKCSNTVGGIIPFARESLGFMVMDLCDGEMEIRRYSIDDECEMTPPDKRWRLHWPYEPSKPEYGANRSAAVPQFPRGDRVFIRYDYGFVHFLFDPAVGADGVESYRFSVTPLAADGTKGPSKDWFFISDYYRLKSKRGGRVSLRAPAFSLEPARRYLISVYPRNWFGQEGAPLSGEFTILAGYHFRNVDESYPQE